MEAIREQTGLRSRADEILLRKSGKGVKRALRHRIAGNDGDMPDDLDDILTKSVRDQSSNFVSICRERPQFDLRDRGQLR